MRAVGIWRQMEMMKELSIPGTVALNSLVCEVYPQVVRACMELGWEFMGHGRTNSESLNGMDEHRERDVIAEVLSRIEAFTGRWPAGWLGPGLAETHRTLDILAEYGVRYTADWVNDDQPHRLHTSHGDIVSLPYSNEINDIGVFRRGQTGGEFEQIIKDQFDQLYEDSAHTGRVMCIALHPYITGVPHRARHLKAAFQYMQGAERRLVCDRLRDPRRLRGVHAGESVGGVSPVEHPSYEQFIALDAGPHVVRLEIAIVSGLRGLAYRAIRLALVAGLKRFDVVDDLLQPVLLQMDA